MKKKIRLTFNDSNDFDAVIMSALLPGSLRSTTIKRLMYDAIIGPRRAPERTPARLQRDTEKPHYETSERPRRDTEQPQGKHTSLDTKKSTLSSVMGDFLEDEPLTPQAGQRFTSEEDRRINEKLKRLSII